MGDDGKKASFMLSAALLLTLGGVFAFVIYAGIGSVRSGRPEFSYGFDFNKTSSILSGYFKDIEEKADSIKRRTSAFLSRLFSPAPDGPEERRADRRTSPPAMDDNWSRTGDSGPLPPPGGRVTLPGGGSGYYRALGGASEPQNYGEDEAWDTRRGARPPRPKRPLPVDQPPGSAAAPEGNSGVAVSLAEERTGSSSSDNTSYRHGTLAAGRGNGDGAGAAAAGESSQGRRSGGVSGLDIEAMKTAANNSYNSRVSASNAAAIAGAAAGGASAPQAGQAQKTTPGNSNSSAAKTKADTALAAVSLPKLYNTVASNKRNGKEPAADPGAKIPATLTQPGGVTRSEAAANGPGAKQEEDDPDKFSTDTSARLEKELQTSLKQIEGAYGEMTDIYFNSCNGNPVCQEHGLRDGYLTMTTVNDAKIDIGYKYVEKKWERYTIDFDPGKTFTQSPEPE